MGSILSGIFLVTAFEPFGWWWLGWVALAPVWIALRASAAVRRHPLRHGYILGLIFTVGSFWWIGATTLAGISFMAFLFSIYPALWFLFLARVIGLPDAARPLPFHKLLGYACAAAAFWVTAEWLRSWFMKGFSWNELGVSQVRSIHFRQVAALGGVSLMSFGLVVASVLWGEAMWSLSRRYWKAAAQATLGGIVLMAAGWGYGWHRLHLYRQEASRTSITYACIQPNIPELPYHTASTKEILRLEVQAMTTQQNLSIQAMIGQPDLLIWPEAITAERLLPYSPLQQVVTHIQGLYRGSLLLGASEVENGKLYNTAYLFNPDHEIQRYHKVYLVVLGEYLPGSNLFPWLTRWWGRGVSAAAGTTPGQFYLRQQKVSLAPLICFEDTQPAIADAAAARRPDFFVTLINAGWFRGCLADWCLTQHLENAVLRCVEHDLPMLRCADTGITCEIDATGRVISEFSLAPGEALETQGTLSGRLYLMPWRPTIYERFGDVAGSLSRLVSLGFCIIWSIRRRPFGPWTGC